MALSRLMTSLGTEAMAGTVIALPVCNPFAFEAQSRATPAHIDGTNLARAFPGDVTGTPTSRLASALFTMATRLLGEDDLMVDLHSAGTRYRYLGLVGFRDIDSPVRTHLKMQLAISASQRPFASGPSPPSAGCSTRRPPTPGSPP